MITLTLKRGALLISSALILSACGGGGGSDMPGPDAGESKRQSLLYAYPDNGQTEVPTPAPVVLRFSSAVTVDAAEAAITLHEGDASGPTLAATFSTVDGEPRGLVLTPDDKLKPLTDYTVVIKNLKLEKGTAANQVLGFTTRPLHEGPRSLVVSSDDFVIERRIPDGGSSEPVMDFSTFRFQFSQPIDPATVHYGNAPASSTAPADNVGLYDSQGNLVDAVLVVNDRYMTVDPNPQSDDPEDKYFSYLTPGETYTLRLGDGITSVYGETFGGDEIAFTPKDSSPRGEPAVLVQRITDSANRTNLSPLTGKPINEVPVNGVLLGEDANITQASNNAVMAELADVTQYPDVTPIRLPRNTVLDGSSIDVLIGGHVPAGFSSGQVEMRMLSDATGYLVPNPYNSNRSDALRIVHLFMDVAIATEDPRTNGAFTQDILHIELIGTAAVDTTEGVLNIDAVSVVEPNVLGQEYGYGLLSFQLQSYKDQQNPPVDAVAEMEDNQPPVLQSWTLGDYTDHDGITRSKADLYIPGDPIVLNFSEPLLNESLRDQVRLYENGMEVPTDVHADGAALVITPQEPLKYDYETEENIYQLQVDSGVSDRAGNPIQATIDETFSLPYIVETGFKLVDGNGTPINDTREVPKHAPLVLSVYPGFPCALDHTTADLENNIVGRCLNSFPGWDQGGADDIKPADDLLPLSSLPANRPIIAQFSKAIDPHSVSLGGSFLVEHSASGGVADDWEAVQGRLEKSGKSITFWPEQNWVEGELYRYVLRSNGDRHSSTADCSGSGAICDLDGLPLQTAIFADLNISAYANGVNNDKQYFFKTTPINYESGGPDMAQFFRAEPPSNNVLMTLKNGPSFDANANFIHDHNFDITQEMLMDDMGNILVYPAVANPYSAMVFSDRQEQGADHQPPLALPNTDLDPGGIAPPPNSAKLLSRQPLPGYTVRDVMPDTEFLGLNGANFGCGFTGAQAVQVQLSGTPTPPPIGGTALTQAAECPSQKFTYLNGSLVTEVTNEYEEGKGLKVIIWPGQLMSSAVPLYTQAGFFFYLMESSSGAQVMRMRYSSENGDQRVTPIAGWIREENGMPVLDATVDMYIDGIDLTSHIPMTVTDNSHSSISVPVTISLSGPVEFMNDGRMVITQRNTDNIDFDIKIWTNQGLLAGIIPVRIPESGTNIQYVSEPIK
ncbi:MAG: Ig-like domain-containing protein [Alcanivorax sp.]|jgi:Big-like domain-containing protein|nr:Ig-like domain-containing protein [Alcanivorax sp.]